MTQFAPKEGEYVFFRYDDTQTIITVLNTAKEKKTISIQHYAERAKGFTKMENILTGENTDIKDFSLEPMGSSVWELVK